MTICANPSNGRYCRARSACFETDRDTCRRYRTKCGESLYGLADSLGNSVDLGSAALRPMTKTVHEQTNANRVSICIENSENVPVEDMTAGHAPHIVAKDLTTLSRINAQSLIVSGSRVFEYLELSRRTEAVTSLLLTPPVWMSYPWVAHCNANRWWCVYRGRAKGGHHRSRSCCCCRTQRRID